MQELDLPFFLVLLLDGTGRLPLLTTIIIVRLRRLLSLGSLVRVGGTAAEVEVNIVVIIIIVHVVVPLGTGGRFRLGGRVGGRCRSRSSSRLGSTGGGLVGVVVVVAVKKY